MYNFIQMEFTKNTGYFCLIFLRRDRWNSLAIREKEKKKRRSTCTPVFSRKIYDTDFTVSGNDIRPRLCTASWKKRERRKKRCEYVVAVCVAFIFPSLTSRSHLPPLCCASELLEQELYTRRIAVNGRATSGYWISNCPYLRCLCTRMVDRFWKLVMRVMESQNYRVTVFLKRYATLCAQFICNGEKKRRYEYNTSWNEKTIFRERLKRNYWMFMLHYCRLANWNVRMHFIVLLKVREIYLRKSLGNVRCIFQFSEFSWILQIQILWGIIRIIGIYLFIVSQVAT